MDVTLKTLPDYHVAYLRYVGPYGSADITQLWNVLKRWCLSQTRDSQPRELFGISHDDPAITPPNLCRYDFFIKFHREVLPTLYFGVQTIPARPYACARFAGKVADIGSAWQWMFHEWLPANGLERDAGPCYERYGGDMEELSEDGLLACEICIPPRRPRPGRR